VRIPVQVTLTEMVSFDLEQEDLDELDEITPATVHDLAVEVFKVSDAIRTGGDYRVDIDYDFAASPEETEQ
jgi:hypothetical protein